MFILWIPGEPKGKGRPRFTKTGQTYTPKETRLYEHQIQRCFTEKYGGSSPIPKGIPVDVEISAYFTRAKSNKDDYPVKKPDCDNIIKVICDALNGFAYHDDAQIVSIRTDKRYEKMGDPGVRVLIREMADREDMPQKGVKD